MAKTQTNEVAKITDTFLPNTFEEALAHYDVITFEGSPYAVTDKADLLGVDMVVLDYKFHQGSFGEFVSVMAITHDNRRVVFSDGSSGIYEQFRFMKDQAPNTTGGIRLPKGLTVSRYTYLDKVTGKELPAATYYVA